MSVTSPIEWTDGTWNFVVGCEPVSAGCAHCYAVRDAHGRFKDIQTYERAHRADLAHTAKGEVAARKKRARKKTARRKK